MKRLFLFILLFYYSNVLFAQAKFTEIGLIKGLTYIYPGIDLLDTGGGVTIVDVNNDGWDDIIQSAGIFKSKLWINNKGKFEDKTFEYFSNFLDTTFIQSTVSGDFDNDGYCDLFICNYGNGMGGMGDKKTPILFKNIEGKYFKPVFVETFNEIGAYSSAAWGDINNDGYLDLFIANYVSKMSQKKYGVDNVIGYDPTCLENKFYINLSGKGFKEVSNKYNFNDDGCGLTVCFTDFDNDSDIDVMLLNDFGGWNHKGNQLYRNEFPKDTFSNISKSSGFYKEMYGMGVGVGDYDNDGNLDYYITNIGENILFNNTTNGTFVSVAKNLKIDNTWVTDSIRGTSWSPLWFDVDNDSDLDLYIGTGNVKTMTPRTAIKDPNKFYLNIGNGKFKDVSYGSNVDDILSHRGAAFFDFDHDGDLDIISSIIKMGWADFGGMDQRIKLFRNDLKKGKNKNWIGFKLIGTDLINKDAIGSHVIIEVNGVKQIREVDGGSGHSSQSTKNLYFGVGKNKKIDNLLVKWIGGKILNVKNLKVGHVYNVYQNGTVSILY